MKVKQFAGVLGFCVLWMVTGCRGGTAYPSSLTPTVTPGVEVVSATATATLTPGADSGPGLSVSAIRFFPQPLAAGDVASIDVIPRLPEDLTETVTVTVELPNGGSLTTQVVPQGLDNAARARFYWAWHTAGLSGTQLLTVSLVLPAGVSDLNPDDNRHVFTVKLEDPTALFPPEPGTRWMSTTTPSRLNLHYLTGSAAERDLPALVEAVEAVYQEASAKLAPSTEPVDVYLLDRVFGQGGYASEGWIAISYVDRSYFPSDLRMLLLHELIHRLDGAITCDGAPALVREGLAVYLGGGHYRRESVDRNVAAILQAGRFIPLAELNQDFYSHQHEISYQEAAALLAYVADSGAGWEGVRQVCQTSATATGDENEKLEAGLKAVGFESLADFELQWREWLESMDVGSEDVTALELQFRYMDTMRDYQRRYDLSAHFLEGVLFDPKSGEQQGNTADFVRRPHSPEAVTLELLLLTTRNALDDGNLSRAESSLELVEATLKGGFPTTGPVAQTRSLVEALWNRGYELYNWNCSTADFCTVYTIDRAMWPAHRTFVAVSGAAGWEIKEP